MTYLSVIRIFLCAVCVQKEFGFILLKVHKLEVVNQELLHQLMGMFQKGKTGSLAMGSGDRDVGTAEFERQKISADRDCPPGRGAFATQFFFPEPAVQLMQVNINRIQNEEDAAKTVNMFIGSSEVGTEPHPLKVSNVSPCSVIVPRINARQSQSGKVGDGLMQLTVYTW